MLKARKRNWRKKTSPCYVEEHHIFPVSIFGSNSKIVCLTAREHYVAHALLYKALKKRYGPNHPRAIKMCYAYWCMSNGKTKNRYVNSKLYEKLRKEFSDGISGENSHWWGRAHSHETKKKMSEKRRGKNNPRWGKTHSPETRKKISEKAKLRTGENSSWWGKSGENNPAFGKMWITNGEVSRFVSKNSPMPNGFRPGRICRAQPIITLQ